MKLALLGTGMIVRELLPVLEELGIQPAALLSTRRSRERGEELAKQFGIPYLYTEYEELLDSDVDTVYVGLPNRLHYAYAKAALLKGKHVIVEKPMVMTLEEFRELRSLARERRLVLVEAMTLHYLPVLASMKEDLALLGKLRLVCFNYSQYSSRYDAFRQGTIAPAFDPSLGGGALMDLNVYNLHAALYLFGSPEGASYTPNLQREVDTSGALTLDYGDMTAICLAAKDCQGPNRSLITGEKGWLEFQGPASRVCEYEVTLRSGEVLHRGFPEPVHRMAPEFEAFREMIDAGQWERGEAALDLSEAATRILEAARPYNLKNI